MDRREVLTGLGALGLAALAQSTVAAEGEMDHAHEHHHDHGAGKYQGLIDAAGDCVQKGEACAAHCNTLLAQGDKDMAACQATALQSVAICNALRQLANLNSPHLVKVAAAAADICKACEDECRKHEKKHEVCKACGDACAACVKQCRALSA
jgi:Cys-rich four helix bundle protein (predicted Tat secretion target)